MATSTRSTVVGVFHERHDAERAIDALKKKGFHDDQLGIAVRDADKGEGTIRSEGDAGDAGGGAATGAITGGVVGGVLGALAAGLIPGIGPVLAGGLLAGVLGGAAAGAAAGGLIGALSGMGVPEDEAKYYNEEFESGRTLVTVKADGRYDEARRILQDHGAYDIENRGSTAAATMPSQSAVDTATRTDRANVANVPERQTTSAEMPERRRTNSDEIELREEELTARKERTEAGKVEIEKDVVTEHRAMDVPVTREEVTVTRRPADRRPTGDHIDDNEEIEMELSEEEVIAEKRTVPYEVVGLEKRTVQDTERVEADVRKEVARTKGMGDVDVNESGSRNYGSMSWDEAMPQYQQRWQERYGTSGGRWQDYEPGYRYSHEMANDPRFRDRDWNEVEPEFQRGYADWSRQSGYRSEGNAWDKVRNNVRESWEEARTRGSRR